MRDRLREVAAVVGPVGLQSISLAGMIPKIGLTKTSQGHGQRGATERLRPGFSRWLMRPTPQ